MRILTLIPARSGSKGIKNKNIKLLKGKPLIAYTIESALQSKYLEQEDIICSTDSGEIAKIAREYGATTPFIRPAEYARDTSSSVLVAKHALNFMYHEMNKEYDYLLLLQPTSPLRRASHIDEAIELMQKTKKDSVISVTTPEQSPYKIKKVNENNELVDLIQLNLDYKRRQDLPEVYAQNGAIYLTKTKILLEKNSFFGECSIGYYMKKEYSIDIDEYIDLKIAEYLLSLNEENE